MRVSGRLRWLAVAVLALMAQAASVFALDIEFTGGPVHRDILAVYDSRHEATPDVTRIHHFAEMPLNWLGLSVTYVDVNGPLPAPETLVKYRGIVTWFIEPLGVATRYLDWLDVATAKGLKLVVFSELAPGAPATSDRINARVHARLGLQLTNDFVASTRKIKPVIVTPEMIGFERPVDKALPEFRVLRQIDPKITAHVAAPAVGAGGDQMAVIVATGPGGGYVSDEYSIVFDANTDRVRWTLNPFAFFKLALTRERMPVPDVTTLSGRRIYFSHIDGDGWNSVSQIDRYKAAQVLSAEVIRREAIEAFPDLPVTIGVIAGDMMPDLGGNILGREVARKLYALPQVEVGSHTYTHPFDWGFFQSYARSAEEAMIDKVRAPELPTLQRVRNMLYTVAGRPVPIDLAGRYVAGSSDLPRTYLREPFDLQLEIAGALGVSESLAPPGKKAKLYLWSGNCIPFEGAVQATRAAGVRNMNGGDSRLDAEFPSVFYVPPISKPVGRERQIYSGNSNENTYTNDWTGPFYGFSLLSETIRNTETPRRLKPFNAYYHMYSGERESALAALRQNLNLARQSPITPIAASQYAAIADDFFSVSMAQVDTMAWSIGTRGELQTVRFDDADGLRVDAAQSRGVLGFTRHGGGAMYVSLDPAVEPAVVALTALKREKSDAVATVPAGASLVSSRWFFRGYETAGCGFAVTAEGYGAGEMLWQTAPGRRFDVIAERDGRELTRTTVVADAAGDLQLSVNADAITPLRLRFACYE